MAVSGIWVVGEKVTESTFLAFTVHMRNKEGGSEPVGRDARCEVVKIQVGI